MPRRRAWRQLLDAIGGSLPPPPARPRIAPGQLLYIIDVAASLAGGVLVIELMTRDRKANGEWGKPKPARLTPADMQSLPDATERHTLERLVGARPHFNYGSVDGLRVRAVALPPARCAGGRRRAASVRNRTLPGARDRAAPARAVSSRSSRSRGTTVPRGGSPSVSAATTSNRSMSSTDRWCGTPSGWR